MNRRVSHIHTRTHTHPHARPVLVGRPEIRRGYASRSRYIGYTQPAYPPPHRTGLGVGPIKFYDLYPSRISRSWPTASRSSDSALFAVFFLLAHPSAFFTVCRLYRKKGEWLRKSITSIRAHQVFFNSLIVPTFTPHWSSQVGVLKCNTCLLIYARYKFHCVTDTHTVTISK